MKKCPQCGTILEETKKKCYMCGADLQKQAFGEFGDAFDEQVGATVSNGQDNVFNNITSVISGVSNPVSEASNQVTFSKAMNSAVELQEGVGENVPSTPSYDNRTAIEKIFSADERYKNNDNFNFSNNASSVQEFFEVPTDNIPAATPPPPPKQHVNKSFINEEVINKKVKEKPSINWGDNLKNSLFSKNDGENNGFKLNLNTIFNIGSVIFFIVTVIFLYFNFLSPKAVNGPQKLVGLSYEISEDFNLAGNSNTVRYYTYGPECALTISYGATVETDGFVDSYYEKVKSDNANLNTRITEIKIKGNTWTEISVLDFQKNAAAPNDYSEVLKYKYSVIVHKGNYYDIVFANENDDAKCASMYDKFMKTLDLD